MMQMACGDEAGHSPDVTKPPPRGDFLILPLHIHILTAADHPEIDCKLSDGDIDRIVGKMNKVWSVGGIAFRIASLNREAAVNLDEFDKQKDRIAAGALGVYRLLAPPATRDLPGLHIYFIHAFAVNGVYLGGNICFVQETARLRKVNGGIDEPIPRVSSHELGHALSLVHRQATFNLMASGTTGTILNEMEVAHSRATAKKVSGMMTVEECEAAAATAEKAGDEKAAKALKTVLAGLPAAEK
jgi:hypothetical protein